MESVSKYVKVPAPGEVINFDDAWEGIKFGERNRRKVTFGHRGEHPDNPPSVCVGFVTPSNTETQVGFMTGDSMLARAFNLPIKTVVSTEPFGAGEVIAEADGSFLQELLFFVSADGKADPAGRRKKTVWNPQRKALEVVDAPSRPGLRANTKYYITRYWKVVHEGGNPPLGLEYMGTDDVAHGGEQPIVAVQPIVAIDVPAGTEGIRINLGPLGPGVFMPD